MFIFNLIGAGMIGAAILTGILVGGVTSLTTRDDQLPFATGASAALLMGTGLDLWYRWTHYRDQGWVRWINPATGGMLWFIPIWGWLGAIPAGGVGILLIRTVLGLQ